MADNSTLTRFFAAMNSGEGFVSMFDDIFFGENISRRYIIKGGPGTGKSSFLRRVAHRAEERGAFVEYYYCSSDTSSLDGIVIDGRIALLDGTAPHSCDTVLAGVCDEIVNLGAFWNAQQLFADGEKIRALSSQKTAAYRNAYGYLKGALAVGRTSGELTGACVFEDKLKSAAARDIGRLELCGKGKMRYCQTEAMGVKGYVYFPTLAEGAGRLHVIDDCHGTAWIYLGEIKRLAEAAGREIWISLDTVDKSKVREIFFPESGDCFTCVFSDTSGEHRHINMKRFVDADKYADIRQTHRCAVGCYDKLCRLALDALAEAGRAHSEMEKYYIASMDFGALEKYCGEFIDKLAIL